MYLYLGGDTALPLRGLIGIFDLDTATVQKSSRDFLRCAQQERRVHDTCGGAELPKSFVLADRGVFLSPHSSGTLQKRVIESTKNT